MISSLFYKIFSLIFSIISIDNFEKLNNKLLLLYRCWQRAKVAKIGNAVYFAVNVKIRGGNKILIGDRCCFNKFCIIEAIEEYSIQSDDYLIKIGNNCNFGEFTHITAINKIIIGTGVLTGRFVTITDNSHGECRKEEMSIPPFDRIVFSKGQVCIEDNVWIGDKVTILPGVHIGRGSIIGANSVVTRDVPPYCIVAGIPAIVKKRIYETE